MNPNDPRERQRQSGQSDEAPAQQGGTPRPKQQGQRSEASRQQDQQNLDEIGSDEDMEVEPLESDDDEEETSRTDDR